MEFRLSPHSGNWQYARSKRTPRAARRTMFGVFTSGCPYAPMSAFRSSAMMKKTFGFFAAASANDECGMTND
jgi:hypothetical protein